VGEILDVGIKIYWRNAWTLIRIVLLVVLPTQILVNLIQASSRPSNSGFTFDESNGTFSAHSTTTLFAGTIAAVIIGAIAGKLAQAACFRAVADAYLGETANWRSSLAFAFRRLHSVIWVSILSAIAIAVGTIACIIPGIYLWAAFYVAIPVVLLEGQGGFKALGRSRHLVSGRWWGTFGVALVGTVMTAIIGSVLALLIAALSLTRSDQGDIVAFIASTASGTVASLITTPAAAAFATVLYIDLRVRKEGFDLLLLAQRMGVAPPEGAAPDLLPPAPFEGEQPPFWPPPPGWQPGGGSSAAPAPEPEPEQPAEGSDQPPFWPPPPGWRPGGGESGT
jgi:hypothetical protein